MNKILIIDDDPLVLGYMKKLLIREGYNIVTASDGKIAKRIIESESFDMIITDILMPEIDGIEIITFIKKMNLDIKIITVSGGGKISGPEYLELTQGLGAHLTFAKPFDEQEFLIGVKSLI